MITLPLPSGWTVAMCYTFTGLPPDDTSGLSLNAIELWCRLTSPDGVGSGWHRVECSKSLTNSLLWWDLVESEADIPAAWAGCVGGVWPPAPVGAPHG
jgi:hypothetical protein